MLLGNKIVAEGLRELAQRIADNIARNGQTASGKTARSLEVVDEGSYVTLYGRRAFRTIETGTPPLGDKISLNSFAGILYRWSQDKGIVFADENERWSFAYAVAKKIKASGSNLFRRGGRDDVYSNEIPKAVEDIRTRLTNALKLYVEESLPINTNEQ